MIYRIVEYGICCDNEDCKTMRHAHTFGWQSRAQAIEEATKKGWVKLTRGRWLCKSCAGLLVLKVERKRDGFTFGKDG